MPSPVKLLADALAIADRPLAEHCRRVACYSRELAKALGEDEEARRHVSVAALIHDIGFLRLPRRVFDIPPQRMTVQDRTLHHEHSAAGEALLAEYYPVAPVAQAVRSHHERFDGQGYPDGLAGDHIPRAARILFVADVFDTVLVGEMFGQHQARPWEAVDHLRAVAGTELDPEMVDAFVTLLERLPVLCQPADPLDPSYRIAYLKAGVVVPGDLVSHDGMVLLKRGSQVTASLLERVRDRFSGLRVVLPARP